MRLPTANAQDPLLHADEATPLLFGKVRTSYVPSRGPEVVSRHV